MKEWACLLMLLLTAGGSACAQNRDDSTFSLLFNSSLGFSHAHDAHIDHWLKEYGYPAEPMVATSLNFEAGAIPADSRLLYSVHLSTITNASDLTAFNLGAGLFVAPVKTDHFMLFLGGASGYHADIITLDGNLPPAYEDVRVKYNAPLSLRRWGLSVTPAMRLFWYPVRLGDVLQLGITGGLGYDIDFNSSWRLGYYSDVHGKYDHFKKVEKPNDQQTVTEYGFVTNIGLSFRFNLH